MNKIDNESKMNKINNESKMNKINNENNKRSVQFLNGPRVSRKTIPDTEPSLMDKNTSRQTHSTQEKNPSYLLFKNENIKALD